MRIPSVSSCFSIDEVSFSDEGSDSKHVSSVIAAILKLSALLFLDPGMREVGEMEGEGLGGMVAGY